MASRSDRGGEKGRQGRTGKSYGGEITQGLYGGSNLDAGLLFMEMKAPQTNEPARSLKYHHLLPAHLAAPPPARRSLQGVAVPLGR